MEKRIDYQVRRNGHKKPPTNPTVLENLVIPGVKFEDDQYAKLRLRLDCYDDMIIARKFTDGQGGGLYALDPAAVATALARMTLSTPLLPRNCLFWQKTDGAERIGIYCEPQVWTVNVVMDGERKTWRVPMPGLVWVGQEGGYKLWAVKGGEWPTVETELFKAPCPNVNNDICRGSVEFSAATVETIWPALRLFFESDFNNHLSDGKSRARRGSILEVWRTLHLAEATTYPEDDLVGASLTMGRVMQ